MSAVSIYTMFKGGFYDGLIIKHLPAGDQLQTYATDLEGTPEALALNEAKNLAGPELLQLTLVLRIILIVAFTCLVVYTRSEKARQPATAWVILIKRRP
ncbi:hypothetical protein [Chitinophaga agri]|uniref:hypothetical protein n=1 Tax=Chitinophaga agri TaxID=2703787 RepID=UPI00192EF9DA|nr:hypothetical protein [Chitinophaga agri]